MVTITGGDKLAARLTEIAARLSKPATLRVGFLEGSTDPEGNSIPLRAAIHNFGAPAAGIPPRPFFSNMVADKSPGWDETLGKLLKASDYDATKALGQMGKIIEGELTESILDTKAPPLKQATIDRKGFDQPLIEHGDMIRAVASEVKE